MPKIEFQLSVTENAQLGSSCNNKNSFGENHCKSGTICADNLQLSYIITFGLHSYIQLNLADNCKF